MINCSYSRQNLLSNNTCKSNENVCVQQQQQQHHAVNQSLASAQPHSSYTGRNAVSSSTLHHVHHNILPVMDNKYFMHFRNQIHQARGDETANANPASDYGSPNIYNSSSLSVNFSSEPVFDEQLHDQQSAINDTSAIDHGQAAAAVNNANCISNDQNKHKLIRSGSLQSNRCFDSILRSGIEASGFSRDRNMSISNQLNTPNSKLVYIIT